MRKPTWLLFPAVLLLMGEAGSGAVRDTDDPHLMPYYTGKVFPTPQEVLYRDEFYPLSRTGVLVGKDVENPAPLVKVLADRISRYGGNAEVAVPPAEGYETLVSLGETSVSGKVRDLPQVPQREQGYLVHPATLDGRGVVILKGRDRQGLLWAVASFNQLVHRRDGKAAVRTAEIRDYPVGQKRGYLHGNVNTFGPGYTALQSTLYNAHFKLNKPIYKHLAFPYREIKFRKGIWRDLKNLPDANREHIKQLGELLSPLGIEWYGGMHPVYDYPEGKLCGSDEDLQVMSRYAALIAEVGGNFYLQFDDTRFPLNPYDVKRFGTAREADAHIVRTLIGELNAKYPKARILFLPPFYWGPTSRADDYGEPRDDYLFELGKRLPENVEIQWTGPRVKSTVIKKEDVQWITERIRRKPVIFQNGSDTPHPHYAHYPTDPVRAWPAWLYDGFVTDVDSYLYNGVLPGDCIRIATIADYFWNPKAYDPEKSAEEAAKKLTGPECYETLKKLSAELSYFDVYGLEVTPFAMQHVDEMEAKLKQIQLLWQEALSESKAAGVYTATEGVVGQVRAYVETLRKSPAPKDFPANVAAAKQQAEKEAGFNEKTDKLLSAYDFPGGFGPRHYGNRCENRFCVWVYGTKTPFHTVQAIFTVDPFPASGDYLLIVSGQDDEAERKCRIRVSTNGEKVFEGDCPFVRFGWSTHTFRLPARVLRRQNQLTMQNLDEGHKGGAPWFMVNYAVVRPAK